MVIMQPKSHADIYQAENIPDMVVWGRFMARASKNIQAYPQAQLSIPVQVAVSVPGP
jgi:hypothetical protein